MVADETGIHTINLRGSWKLHILPRGESDSKSALHSEFGNLPLTLSLPTSLATDQTDLKFSLERRFSTPTGLSESQTVTLKIVANCGIDRILLNGALLAADPQLHEFTINDKLSSSHKKNVLEFTTFDGSPGSLDEVLLLIS